MASRTGNWIGYKNLLFPYDSPGLIINATLFFCLFAKQEIQYRAWINKFAALVPFIYLLHENILTEYVYRQYLSVWGVQYAFPIAFSVMIGITLILMILCGLCGVLFSLMVNKLLYFVEHLITK